MRGRGGEGGQLRPQRHRPHEPRIGTVLGVALPRQAPLTFGPLRGPGVHFLPAQVISNFQGRLGEFTGNDVEVEALGMDQLVERILALVRPGGEIRMGEVAILRGRRHTGRQVQAAPGIRRIHSLRREQWDGVAAWAMLFDGGFLAHCDGVVARPQ